VYEDVDPVYTGEWATAHPSDVDIFVEMGAEIQDYAKYQNGNGRILFAAKAKEDRDIYEGIVILTEIKNSLYVHGSLRDKSPRHRFHGFNKVSLELAKTTTDNGESFVDFGDKIGLMRPYKYDEELKATLVSALDPSEPQKGRRLHV